MPAVSSRRPLVQGLSAGVNEKRRPVGQRLCVFLRTANYATQSAGHAYVVSVMV